jgi:hypothetical protein
VSIHSGVSLRAVPASPIARQSAKRGLPPERVAKVIRHALTSARPKARYLVGPQAHMGALLNRLSFRLTRRLTAARG